MAEHGGTQQNSREDFAQNRRLSQLLHQFAGELRGTQKGSEGQEHDHYVVLRQVRHAEPLLFRAISANLHLARAIVYRKSALRLIGTLGNPGFGLFAAI
jgi:hypothetical protein